jgi:hypothetical protein
MRIKNDTNTVILNIGMIYPVHLQREMSLNLRLKTAVNHLKIHHTVKKVPCVRTGFIKQDFHLTVMILIVTLIKGSILLLKLMYQFYRKIMNHQLIGRERRNSLGRIFKHKLILKISKRKMTKRRKKTKITSTYTNTYSITHSAVWVQAHQFVTMKVM